MQVRVEVTTLASMVLVEHKLSIENVVRDFVAEQLSKGRASYWNPERFPRLEINADMAEYTVSKRSAKQ